MGRQLNFYWCQQAEELIAESCRLVEFKIYHLARDRAIGFTRPTHDSPFFDGEFIQMSPPRSDKQLACRLWIDPCFNNGSKKSLMFLEGFESLRKSIKRQSKYHRASSVWVLRESWDDYLTRWNARQETTEALVDDNLACLRVWKSDIDKMKV